MANKFKEQLMDPEIASPHSRNASIQLWTQNMPTHRSNRLTWLIKAAGCAFSNVCLEDIEYHADRALDKALIARLGTRAFVREHRNVIILGATGSGKSYLANVLGMTASRNFLAVKYIRLPELLVNLPITHAEGNYRKVFKQYRQVNLLIFDERLLCPLKEVEARDFRDLFEIAEARCKKGFTIFCSQFELPGWHQKLGDATMADAICDRMVHGF